MAAVPTRDEIHRVQAIAGQLGQRAMADPTFLKQVLADPRGTVQAAGIPAEAVDELLTKQSTSPEVPAGCFISCIATP